MSAELGFWEVWLRKSEWLTKKGRKMNMDYVEDVLNLEQAICEKSQVVIGNVNYVVTSFFSPSGNESVYDQFMRLLTRQFAHSQ